MHPQPEAGAGADSDDALVSGWGVRRLGLAVPRESSGLFLVCRDTEPSGGPLLVPSPTPDHPLKAPPAPALTLRVGLRHRDSGDTNIQS